MYIEEYFFEYGCLQGLFIFKSGIDSCKIINSSRMYIKAGGWRKICMNQEMILCLADVMRVENCPPRLICSQYTAPLRFVSKHIYGSPLFSCHIQFFNLYLLWFQNANLMRDINAANEMKSICLNLEINVDYVSVVPEFHVTKRIGEHVLTGHDGGTRDPEIHCK